MANNKDAYWFTHDCNASTDPKIIAMRSKWYNDGYGMWWLLIETLREQSEYRFDISTRFAYPFLAKRLDVTVEKTKEYIQDCINEYDLIKTDGIFIWSDSLCRRMGGWDEKKETYSKRGKAGAAARWAQNGGQGGESDTENTTSINSDATSILENASSIKNDAYEMAYINKQINSIDKQGGKPPIYPKIDLKPVSEEYKKFNEWITANAPRVLKMKDPFNQEQYEKLQDIVKAKGYTWDQVREKLAAMHNRADLLKKYVSAYSTLTSWLSMINNKPQFNTGGSSSVNPIMPKLN